MASPMNSWLLLLLFATSYCSLAAANSNANIVSITLTNGIVYCTINGNPDQSCGGTSCPPAVNATVTLAVKDTNIVIARTTTNTSGLYSFNLIYNVTNLAPVNRQNINDAVVYVSLPVADCSSLSGAGILRVRLVTQTSSVAGGVAVTLKPLSPNRY